MPITVIHRVDGSGTTFNWTNYLSKASSEWKASVGEGPAVEWPVGLGGRGNGGMASLVDLTPGSIGYLEYSYVMQKKGTIAYGLVQNFKRGLDQCQGLLTDHDECSRRAGLPHHRDGVRVDAQTTEVARGCGRRPGFPKMGAGARLAYWKAQFASWKGQR